MLDDLPVPPALLFTLLGYSAAQETQSPRSTKTYGYGELRGRFVSSHGAMSSAAMRAHLSTCLKALLRQAAESSTMTILQSKLSDVPSTAVVQFNQVHTGLCVPLVARSYSGLARYLSLTQLACAGGPAVCARGQCLYPPVVQATSREIGGRASAHFRRACNILHGARRADR